MKSESDWVRICWDIINGLLHPPTHSSPHLSLWSMAASQGWNWRRQWLLHGPKPSEPRSDLPVAMGNYRGNNPVTFSTCVYKQFMKTPMGSKFLGWHLMYLRWGFYKHIYTIPVLAYLWFSLPAWMTFPDLNVFARQQGHPPPTSLASWFPVPHTLLRVSTKYLPRLFFSFSRVGSFPPHPTPTAPYPLTSAPRTR